MAWYDYKTSQRSRMNRILPAGTLSMDQETGEYKIGNGKTLWEELSTFPLPEPLVTTFEFSTLTSDILTTTGCDTGIVIPAGSFFRMGMTLTEDLTDAIGSTRIVLGKETGYQGIFAVLQNSPFEDIFQDGPDDEVRSINNQNITDMLYNTVEFSVWAYIRYNNNDPTPPVTGAGILFMDLITTVS